VKKSEEEHLKARTAKAATTQDIMAVAMVSPPADTTNHEGTSDPLLEKDLTNELYAMTMEELTKHGIETCGFSKVEENLYAADIKEKMQAMKNVEQQALCLDSAEAKEHLACHSMQPNH
jgi:hypothetical protein